MHSCYLKCLFFFVCVKDPFNSHLQEKSSWVGRELLEGSKDLHPVLMNHPRIPVVLEVKMRLSSADFEGGGRRKSR